MELNLNHMKSRHRIVYDKLTLDKPPENNANEKSAR